MKRPEGFDRPEQPTPAPKAQAGRATRAAKAPAVKPSSAAASPSNDRQKPVRERPDKQPRERAAKAPRSWEYEQSPARTRHAEERAQRRLERAEARRFTRDSRRRRITWISVGAIFVVLVAVLAVAIFSPVLALRTIRVEGASAVKASAIRGALDDQLGTPLALLDNARIDKDLSQFTLIRSYVTEIVPPYTLVVRIEERQAIGVVQDGSVYDRVDPAGVVLGRSATRDRLPIIDIGTAKVGGAAFTAAVKVLLAMPSSVASQVQTVSATTLDNVNLTLTGGKHTVIWGSSAGSDAKAQVLAVLLHTSRCRSLPVLNVTAPTVVSCGKAQPSSQPTSKPTGSPTGTPTATPSG